MYISLKSMLFSDDRFNTYYSTNTELQKYANNVEGAKNIESMEAILSYYLLSTKMTTGKNDYRESFFHR